MVLSSWAFPSAKCAALNDISSPAPDDVASSRDETKDIARRIQPFNACMQLHEDSFGHKSRRVWLLPGFEFAFSLDGPRTPFLSAAPPTHGDAVRKEERTCSGVCSSSRRFYRARQKKSSFVCRASTEANANSPAPCRSKPSPLLPKRAKKNLRGKAGAGAHLLPWTA